MPVEKYTWRPAAGVRSVGEVFTHIVMANYGVARALGTAPPAGFGIVPPWTEEAQQQQKPADKPKR